VQQLNAYSFTTTYSESQGHHAGSTTKMLLNFEAEAKSLRPRSKGPEDKIETETKILASML